MVTSLNLNLDGPLVHRVALAIKRRHPVQVFGTHGMGKRTLLRAAVEVAYPEHDVHLVSVDLARSVASRHLDETERALCETLRMKLPTRVERLLQPGERWTQYLGALLDGVQWDVVLQLDAGDAMLSTPFGQRVLDGLRELAARLIDEFEPWTRLAFVLLVRVPFDRTFLQYNPYALARTEIFDVPAFAPPDVVALARARGLDWTEGDAERLMNLATGGVPRLITLALAHAGPQGVEELIERCPLRDGPLASYLGELESAIANAPDDVRRGVRAWAQGSQSKGNPGAQAFLVSWNVARWEEGRAVPGSRAVDHWVRETYGS